jgi:two-component system sensor histidine kinase BaeS
LAVWLARGVARPLQAVTDTASRIAAGDLATRVATVSGGTGVAELDALMHHINHMAQSLETQQHRQKRWIADISHELRTPLAVLQGEVEALIDGIRVKDEAAMQSLREELLRIGALVQDLHLLSLADLHALPCDFQEGDAWACVLKVVQRFELRAQLAGIRLQCHRPDPGPLMVVWDFQRMAQVLGNLIDNSLNYTQAPGSTHILMQAVGENVQITVEDSAPGVRDDDLLKLLDPLYRAQLDRSRPLGGGQTGSGLGLSIVQVLVQAHGGQMHVLHSAHGGLKVVLTLPREVRP